MLPQFDTAMMHHRGPFLAPPTENEREAQAMLTHRRMVGRARRKEAVMTLWAQLTRLWHVAAPRT